MTSSTAVVTLTDPSVWSPPYTIIARTNRGVLEACLREMLRGHTLQVRQHAHAASLRTVVDPCCFVCRVVVFVVWARHLQVLGRKDRAGMPEGLQLAKLLGVFAIAKNDHKLMQEHCATHAFLRGFMSSGGFVRLEK